MTPSMLKTNDTQREVKQITGEKGLKSILKREEALRPRLCLTHVIFLVLTLCSER